MSEPTVDDLVADAIRAPESDPQATFALLESAHALGLGDSGVRSRGLAEWARGRAFTHLGQRRQAAAALTRAVDLLAESGDREAWARAAVSLAVEWREAGRFSDAIEMFDRASPYLTGGEVARAFAMRALSVHRAGNPAEALESWVQAADGFGAAGMPVEQAVAVQNRGLVRVYRGELDAAEADLASARATFEALGEPIRSFEALHNLGFVAGRRGDLPKALALYDQAQAQAGRLGVLRPQALVDRLEATLDAGLVVEGRRLAEETVGLIERAGFDADLPEACLLASRACEQDGDPAAAARWAARAISLFEVQGRQRWRLLAEYARTRAETAGDSRPADSADRLLQLSGHLEDGAWFAQAVEAAVRAAEILLDDGDRDRGATVLAALAGEIHRVGPLGRFQIRLAQARLAVADRDDLRADRALVSALRSLRAFQATLGSLELRTRAGGRADELMTVAMTMAVATARPDRALWWVEAVRTAQHGGPVVRAGGPDQLALLESLRDVTGLLADESVRLDEAVRLRRRQAAIEELIRRDSRHTPGYRDPWSGIAAPDDLFGHLGRRVLVEFVCAGPRLMAVVVEDGSTRLVDVGALGDVRRIVAGVRLALRVAVSPDDRGDGLAALADAGRAAETAILEPLGIRDPAALVVAPAGPVASLPWSAVPSLARSDITIVTSATAWLESEGRRRRVSGQPNVLVVAGPGLRHAVEEAAAVAAIWGRVTWLAGPDATVGAVVAALAYADVVHVAAHGIHRGDNPLLSGVRLHDGHLTGYELATAPKSADLVVLSCCDTGMAETASGIGLAQILISTGIRSTIASVTPVGDASAVGLMTELHRLLVEAVPPAAALSAARHRLGGPLAAPSSAGFACFGWG